MWGFYGRKTKLGIPYRSVHLYKMHQFELGIFKTYIGILKKMVGEIPRVTFKQRALMILDQRLYVISTNHRYLEFWLLTCKGYTSYFTSNATFQAFEHKFVIQVIIPLSLGIYENSVVRVAISMWQWCSILNQGAHTRHASWNGSIDIRVSIFHELRILRICFMIQDG